MTERTPVYIVTDGADRPTALGVFEDGDTIPSGTLTPNVRDAVEEIDTFDGRLDGVEASTVDLSSYIETNETAWGQGIDPATLADIQEVSNVVTTASGPNEDIRTAYGPYSSLASGTSAAGTAFASVDGTKAVLKRNLDGGFGYSVTGVVNVNATNINATNVTATDLVANGTATLNGLSVTGSVSAGDNFSGTNAYLTGGLSAEGQVSSTGKVISADQIQGDSLRATNNIIVGGTVDGRNVAEDGTKTDDLVTAYAPVSSLASGVSAAASAIESVDSTIVVFSKEVKTTKTYTDNLTSHLTSEITLDANIDAANNDITNVASLGVTDATISNAANVTGNLTVTGTVSAAGDVKTTGSLSSTVGVNTETVSTNTLTHNGAGSITLGRAIDANSRNITGINNLEATGTTTLTTGNITTGTIGTANVTGDLTVTGAYSGAGDVKTTGAFSGTGNVLTDGNVVAQGNVQATSIKVDRLDNNSVGDVTLDTHIDGNNQNITALGIVGATTGNITTVNATDANISNDLTVTGAYSGAGDVKTTGAFSGTGNVTTQGNVSAGGEVAAGTVKVNTLDDDGSTVITLNARIDANSKNISNVNILTAATGTITTGNITTVNATDANLTGDLTVTGAYSGAGDVKTTGAFSGTGNITTLGTVAAATGNITTVNSTTGNITTVEATTVNTANANVTGNISVTGNINVTGTVDGADVAQINNALYIEDGVYYTSGFRVGSSSGIAFDTATTITDNQYYAYNLTKDKFNLVDAPIVNNLGTWTWAETGTINDGSINLPITVNENMTFSGATIQFSGTGGAVDFGDASSIDFGSNQSFTPSSNTFTTRNIIVGNSLSSSPDSNINLDGTTVNLSGSGSFGLSGGAVDIESISTYIKLNSAAYLNAESTTNSNYKSNNNLTVSATNDVTIKSSSSDVSIQDCPYPPPFGYIQLNSDGTAATAETHIGAGATVANTVSNSSHMSWNDTTKLFQVSADGTYNVQVNLAVTAGTATADLKINKNGTAQNTVATRVNGSVDPVERSFSAVFTCSSGDTIDASHTSTNGVNVTALSGSTITVTRIK